MNKIIGFSGSPRRGGNTDTLLKQVLKGAAEAGADTEAVFLRDYLVQPCIGCERCRKARACTGLMDGMQLLYPKIVEARGMVLGSPTHNYNITAWVKAFIDRLYCFYEFGNDRPRAWSSRLAGQGRKALVLAVCEQEDMKDMGLTLPAMEMPLGALGYEVIGQIPAIGFFDAGLVGKDQGLLDLARQKGGELAGALSV
jgi:multimeric flavodoxin WrbA